MTSEEIAIAGHRAAHGLPEMQVRRGDPYLHEVRRTAAALGARLDGRPWSLAFQSRLGPVEWTRPYLEDELESFARSPEPVIIMPLSFVADCLETIYDLDTVDRQLRRLHDLEPATMGFGYRHCAVDPDWATSPRRNPTTCRWSRAAATATTARSCSPPRRSRS